VLDCFACTHAQVATIENEKVKRYPDLAKTVESFERQLKIVIAELYHQKTETISWRTRKMANDEELAATRAHLANVERALKALERNADARVDALRPFLRAARCVLVCACCNGAAL